MLRGFDMAAKDAFENGMGGAGVQHDVAGRGITLYDSTLVEDDGPGIGSDTEYVEEQYRAPVARIGGPARVKKVLVVDRPEAIEARLYIRNPAAIEFNGRTIAAAPGEMYPAVPLDLIRKGENVVVLFAREDSAATIKIAKRSDILRNAPDRANRPARSFRSADGGKTWETIEGELLLRLFLLQYASDGHFISPVIDLGLTGRDPVLSPKFTVRSLALTRDAETPPGTSIAFAVRTGSSPVYEPDSWSDWQPAESPKLVRQPESRRFLQWKAMLKSADPRATPILKSVAIEADLSESPRPGWAANVKVAATRNEEIRYTNIPFEYEDPHHPKLAALRRKYNLDEVVAGAKSEFERLVRLRDWVAHQWKFKPPTEGAYPAWDAEEILQRRIGFCVQYAIVYMQVATSMGYQARFVFGQHPGLTGNMTAGHEICEFWSNEFGKWVAMDVSSNAYYVDPRTNSPLSMLEAHDRLVRNYYGDRPAHYEDRPKAPKYSDEIDDCPGLELVPSTLHKSTDVPPKPDQWPLWTKWLGVRYMPRNTFYSSPYPAPLAQGFHWDWSEYWAWYDAQTPREWHYRHFTSRRSDLHWTINQVRWSASLGDEPGTLAIRMGTVTPYLDSFLVNCDGQGWRKSDRALVWKLHPGRNRIEMRVRNTSGVEGPVSFLEVDA